MTNSKINKVLVGGCFDVLHFGHIKFLNKAKALGNYLIVALESDTNLKRLKGKGRPVHNQNQRKEMLLTLRCVDEVIILKDKMNDKDYLDLVKKVKPSIIAITKDDPITKKRSAQAKAVDAKFVKITKTESPSTTQILNTIPKPEFHSPEA